MARIEDLPDELLLIIFQELAPDPGHPDAGNVNDPMWDRSNLLLAGLARLSRQFGRVAQSLLYRSIHIDINYHDGEDQFTECYQPRLACLLRTLLEDPGKAALVQGPRLMLADWRDESWTARPSEPLTRLTPRACDNVRRTINCAFAEPGDQSDWLEKCLENHELDYLLPFTIATLPALRWLALKQFSARFWENLEQITNGLSRYAVEAGLNEPLESIATVVMIIIKKREEYASIPGIRVHPPKDAEEYAFENTTLPLATIVKWPKLRALSAWNIGEVSIFDNQVFGPDGTFQDNFSKNGPIFRALEPNSTSLTHLSLVHQTIIPGEHLIRLVGAAKALEHFHLDHGNYWVFIGGRTVGTPGNSDIIEALSQQTKSLKTIKIIGGFELEDDLENVVAMDFSSFEKLTDLQIDLRVLRLDTLSHDCQERILKCFPSSLRELCVIGFGWVEDAAVAVTCFSKMLTHQETPCPALKQLSFAREKATFMFNEPIGQPAPEYAIWLEGLRNLRSFAASAGIAFNMCEYVSDTGMLYDLIPTPDLRFWTRVDST